MKKLLAKLIREWGLEPLLEQLIEFIREGDESRCKRLADDMESALDRYRKGKK